MTEAQLDMLKTEFSALLKRLIDAGMDAKTVAEYFIVFGQGGLEGLGEDALPHAHHCLVITKGKGPSAEIIFELCTAGGKPMAHAHFTIESASDFASNLVDLILEEQSSGMTFGPMDAEPSGRPN